MGGPGTLKTYDPSRVVLSFGGHQVSGFGDDTFIEADRDEDSFAKSTGVDGEMTRSKSNNFGGFVQITLKQSSNTNDFLSALLAADEASGAGVVPLLLKDLSGTTVLASAKSWVRRLPANAWARAAGERVWMIDCAALIGLVGGNNED